MQTSKQTITKTTEDSIFFVRTKTFEGVKVAYLRFVHFCAFESFSSQKNRSYPNTLNLCYYSLG